MSDTARDIEQLDNASPEGLDDLFEQQIQPDQSLSNPPIQIDPDRSGVALEEAARSLNLHVDTLRRHLKTGRIRGFKARDKFGNKWFVDKSELPVEIQSDPTLSTPSIQIDQPLSTPQIQPDPILSTPSAQPDPAVDVEVFPDCSDAETTASGAPPSLLAMAEAQMRVIENQSNQLKAAGDVIMYLRSQLEDKENTIRLLTDSQHKPSWWQRVKEFFYKH